MICRVDNLEGKLDLPPSKSYAQRYLMAALFAGGTSVIRRPGSARDTLAMRDAIRQLGAIPSENGKVWRMNGGIQLRGHKRISCGESGLAARLLIPASAIRRDQTDLQLEGSLKSRPFGPYADFFKEAGVRFNKTENGIQLGGGLKAGRYFIEAGLSSQFVSGLLMALPKLRGESRLEFSKPVSRGYISMTLEVLSVCGIEIERKRDSFVIPGGQRYRAFDRQVEADWSAGAVAMIAGALKGSLKLRGLNRESLQPDRVVMEILERAGGKIAWKGSELVVERGPMRPFEYDATDSPDLIPSLAVLACFCTGESSIVGISRLRHKESDRAAALKYNLVNAGYHPVMEGDRLRLQGNPAPDRETLCRWNSFGDHRMLMAGFLFATGSGRPVLLDDVHCVQKSWPEFYDDMKSLGANFDE